MTRTHANHGPVLTRMLGDTGSLIFVVVLIALTVGIPLCNLLAEPGSALHVSNFTVLAIRPSSGSAAMPWACI